MKKIQVVAVSLLVCAVLFIGGVFQKSSGATFNDFKTAVGINDYDIDLTAGGFINPLVWTSTITSFGSSGTVRGASGVNVFVLSGNNCLYQGFRLAGTVSNHKELHFVGNIKFDLFRSTYNGGAIFASYSTITFNNSSANFSNNKSDLLGGAIYTNNGSSFTFNNSSVSFSNNLVGSGSSNGSGGAIYTINGSSFTFNNSSVSFTNNLAAYSGDGGAIYANGGSVFTFNNSSANFSDNKSDRLGGAIYADNGSSFTFNNSRASFSNNSMNVAGGAIYANNSPFTFNNSSVSFTNNSGRTIYYGVSNGGAIYAYNGSSFTFNNSSVRFINNIALSSGGAFYLSHSSVYFSVIDKDILFSGNKANGLNNDIFMTNGSSVSFNVGAARLISMDGGIKGNPDTFIRKTGLGDLVFEQGSITDFKGKLIIDAGTLKAFGANIAISTLQVSANGVYSMNGENRTQNITSVSNGLVGGTLEIEIDFANNWADLIQTTGTVFNINSGSSLTIKAYGDTMANIVTEITILSVSNGAVINGQFTNYDATKYLLIYDPLFTFVKVKLLTGAAAVTWNNFVAAYKGATAALNTDIKAVNGDNAFGSPTTNNNFVINGQYNDIDSDNIADLGFVFSATSATFKNVNFLKFKDSASGGAIDINGGEITVIGSKFQNNNAITNGGAINITDGKLAIIDTNFTGNSAGASGGAIDINGGEITVIGSKFQNNNAITNGGAINITDGKLAIMDTNFTGNLAGTSGGAIYAGGTSEVLIKAQNDNIIFENNQANGIKNDIYAAGLAELELNIANNKTITMKGGILGGGGIINKTGAGNLVFGNSAIVDYKGGFNIQAGIVKMPIPTITISALTIGAGAKLSLVDSAFIQHILYVGSATISGIFDIGLYLPSLSSLAVVDNASDMLISSDTITINTGSLLNISGFGAWKSSGTVKIMTAENGINGWQIWQSQYAGNGDYQIEYEYNSLILRVLASPTPTPPSQDIIARNKFISNTLSLAAKSNGLDDIYNRMEQGAAKQKGNAWVGLYGGGKTADEFSVNSIGGAFGVDVYESKNFMGGLFVRYGSNDIKEKDNKGAMGETEFGIYGGLFEIKNSPINVKANLSMGIESYSMEIGENVDFDGKSFKGGIEVEVVSKISKTTKLKPFIGVQGGMASNDDIKTNDATIKSDSLLRAETKAGIGISGVLGATQNFKWYSRLYGIFLVSGDEPKYKTIDNTGNESEMIGTKEDAIQGAISLGGEYKVGKAISIFVNACADFGTGFGWTSGIGANYKF